MAAGGGAGSAGVRGTPPARGRPWGPGKGWELEGHRMTLVLKGSSAAVLRRGHGQREKPPGGQPIVKIHGGKIQGVGLGECGEGGADGVRWQLDSSARAGEKARISPRMGRLWTDLGRFGRGRRRDAGLWFWTRYMRNACSTLKGDVQKTAVGLEVENRGSKWQVEIA